jgi:hypothetical protein
MTGLPRGNTLSREEAIMSEQPDHELEILEYDQTVPPRPEEDIADAGARDAHQGADQSAPTAAGTPPDAD